MKIIDSETNFLDEIPAKELVEICEEDIKNGVLIIPKNVESIGYLHLENFSNLREIRFESGSKFYAFCDSAFNKGLMKKIDFTNCHELRILGRDCFSELANCEEINFAKNTKIVGWGACTFWRCPKLKSLDFSIFKEMTHIPYGFMEGAFAMTEIDLSSMTNLEVIHDYAFNYCENVEKITFPQNSNLKKISFRAFANIKKVTEVDLSNQPNLEIIQNYVFTDIPHLKRLTFENCHNLKDIRSGVANGQIDEFNLVNCHPDFIWKLTEANPAKFKIGKLFTSTNYRLSFNTIFKKFIENGAKICVVDKGQTVYESELTEDSEIGKLAINNMSALVRLKRYKNEISTDVIRGLYDENCSKIYIKNKARIDEVLAKIKASPTDGNRGTNSAFFYCAMRFLERFGVFGFEGAEKDKNYGILLRQYKNLLAKNMAINQIKNSGKNFENKKEFGDHVQKTADALARDIDLTELALKFIENNFSKVARHDNLFNQIGYMKDKFSITDLKFAMFFVVNFDDIIEQKVNTESVSSKNLNFEEGDGKISLSSIYNSFDDILSVTNKMIVTRSDKERLSVADCEYENTYKNVDEDNKKLASYAGRAHLSSEEFQKLQNIFNQGKSVKDSQILKVLPDNSEEEITYEFIEKDNPLGLVLGNISNCCQIVNGNGEECMIYGATKPNSGFITFNNGKKIIAQSWVWYDEKTKTLAFDNIEVPDVYSKFVNSENPEKMEKCFERLCENFVKTMKNDGLIIDNIIVGASATDFNFLQEIYEKEIRKEKMLPPLENYKGYTDISKNGQYFILRNGVSCKKVLAIDLSGFDQINKKY